MSRRVVITGCGVVTSLSCQPHELWERVVAGQSGIHELRLMDNSEFKVTFAGDVYDFDPTPQVDPREVKRLDRFSQFAMVAGTDAIVDSGITDSSLDPTRVGCILGSGVGGLLTIEEQMTRLINTGSRRVSPLTIPKIMLNAAGGNLAIKYGFKGPNFTVATACASATNAMGDALDAIQDGDADVVVTGGSEAAISRLGVSGFQNMKALSQREGDPTKASRPFDLDRAGFVLSEGAGILVFEELERAKSRGAKIYGEVFGYGESTDAGHITQPDEHGEGTAQAMSGALKSAGLNPEEIDYINAHGTGTPLGDKAETKAVKSVFGDHAHRVSISSTKSQLGHSLGASGGIELIVTVQALQNGVVPPTINLDTPDPDCDLDYTPNQPRERNIKYAMSNSFGFGGHNASIIIGNSI